MNGLRNRRDHWWKFAVFVVHSHVGALVVFIVFGRAAISVAVMDGRGTFLVSVVSVFGGEQTLLCLIPLPSNDFAAINNLLLPFVIAATAATHIIEDCWVVTVHKRNVLIAEATKKLTFTKL